jgi:CDP-3, 6-dideoxy-D-glycero-L-glycero-4-hexulose-4-reductase
MSETNKNLIRYIYLYDNYGINSKRKKFIDTVFNSIKNRQTILASPGDQKMNITSVEDVANCLVKSMDTLQMSDLRREFQIQSKETLTLKEIVTEIEIGLEKKIDINWGATSYREKEVFQLWDCAEILPNMTFQDNLCSYVKKNRKYFYEST